MTTEHSDQSIVVTGTGVVLPTGRHVTPLWDAWTDGKPAISPYLDPVVSTRRITHFGHVPAEVVEQSREAVPHRQRKYGTPYTFNAVLAAQDAIAEAGPGWARVDDHRRGLFVAQDNSTTPSIGTFARGLTQLGEGREIDFGALTNELLMNGGLDPFTIIHALNNNTLALVSIVHELRGDCAALVQGESAAVTALQRATFSLRNGHCDIALVVGAGSYNEPLTLAGHYRLGHLSKDAGGDGQLRSFDSAQDGTILSEGAVALVLERARDATARGATPLVQLCDTVVVSGSRGAGPAHIAHRYDDMLHQNGIGTEQLGAVLADGKAAPGYDIAEIELLTTLFKGSGIPVSTVRPITGTPGAAGPLVDLALAGQIFTENTLPAIAHLGDPLSDQLQFVQGGPRKQRIDSVLGTYTNFNGISSAVLAKRPDAAGAA